MGGGVKNPENFHDVLCLMSYVFCPLSLFVPSRLQAQYVKQGWRVFSHTILGWDQSSPVHSETSSSLAAEKCRRRRRHQLFQCQGTPHVTSKFEPSRERFRPLASPRRDRRPSRPPAGVSLVEILSAARALILPIVFEYKEAEDVDENPKFTRK